MSRMRISAAELSARVLDGEFVRLGDGWTHAAVPVSPERRAASLALPLTPRTVLSHRVAAWVHGCHGFPSRIDITVQAHHRQGIPADPRVRLRRFRLDFRFDTVVLGDVRVTTPERTALHLLGDEECDRSDVTAALLLVGRERLSEAIDSSERVPDRTRELLRRRLAQIQPLVTL